MGLVSAANAQSGACRQTRFGKCYTAHSRYAIYADGDAIWPVGTKRLLDATDPELDQMLEKAGWQDYTLFGDFTVCPTSAYMRGHKQAVCIQAYTHLRLARRR